MVNITADVCFVKNYGCNMSDFDGIPSGCIALISLMGPGDCRVWDKAMNAQQANVSAALVVNPRNITALARGRVLSSLNSGWIEGDPLLSITLLSGSYSLGQSLRSFSGPVTLNIVANQSITITDTYNVHCVSREGRNDSTVVVGAHLDSVPEGPGINDNGSGSSTVLEMALQFFAMGKAPINRVQFSWWGAEEIGLVGSSTFVKRQTTAGTAGNIAAMLNMDMIGSPNFVAIVTDGNTTNYAKNGSIVITDILSTHISAKTGSKPRLQGTSYGRTDFVGFELANIPVGNLFTGAEDLKTQDEAKIYGGIGNAAMDPCYHLACDNVDNINQKALEVMSSAAAHLVELLVTQPNLQEFVHRTK